MDGDVGQSTLASLFSLLWRLRVSVPSDVLELVFWWGRSKGEKLYHARGWRVLWTCSAENRCLVPPAR